MDETDTNEVERGPNGFPYIHPDTQLGQWENGEYRMRVIRKDGEVMNVNMNEVQFKLMVRSVNDLAEKAGIETYTTTENGRDSDQEGDQ